MSAKAVERLWSYSLEHALFMLMVRQQPYVVGKHWTHGNPHACAYGQWSGAPVSGLVDHQACSCTLLVLCLPVVLNTGAPGFCSSVLCFWGYPLSKDRVWMTALDLHQSSTESSYLSLPPSRNISEGQQQRTKSPMSCTGSGSEERVFPAYPRMQVRLWEFFVCKAVVRSRKVFCTDVFSCHWSSVW